MVSLAWICIEQYTPPIEFVAMIISTHEGFHRCATAWTFSNVFAGSDSTAAILRAVWYNLLAHPRTLERLHNELREIEKTRGLKRPIPEWDQVSDLPYLDACINEAVRLHPPFCLPFERVVPQGGIMLGTYYLPEGTVVGMSPYVTNRHRPTFGEDADEWNPNRWLCKDEQQRKKLEQSVLTVRVIYCLAE
jgi:cytochrome P450